MMIVFGLYITGEIHVNFLLSEKYRVAPLATPDSSTNVFNTTSETEEPATEKC